MPQRVKNQSYQKKGAHKPLKSGYARNPHTNRPMKIGGRTHAFVHDGVYADNYKSRSKK
jgi:hypothetical protein